MSNPLNLQGEVNPASRRRNRDRHDRDFSKLHPDQNLTEEEVCFFLGISRSSLRNKITEGNQYYDPSFPRPHPMRGQAKKGCSIRYKAGPVVEWNRAQPECYFGKPLR